MISQMTDTADIYERFPFPEVMREQAQNALEALVRLVTDPEAVPGDGARAAEQLAEIADLEGSHYQMLQTKFEAFVPMYSVIHPVLMEAEIPPRYVVDAFCAMARSFTPPGEVTGTLPGPSDDDLHSVFVERWQTHEAERVTGTPWVLFQASLGRLPAVEVCFLPGQNKWELGYRFSEQRQYEAYGRNICRVIDGGNHKFTDPIGTQGDRDNADEGYYLPTRLRLPTPPEPVKIPTITLIPPRTRPD